VLATNITNCLYIRAITKRRQCPALALKIFSSAWVELIDISRASIRQAPALELRTGLFEGPQ
jgi:hypothetical protein